MSLLSRLATVLTAASALDDRLVLAKAYSSLLLAAAPAFQSQVASLTTQHIADLLAAADSAARLLPLLRLQHDEERQQQQQQQQQLPQQQQQQQQLLQQQQQRAGGRSADEAPVSGGTSAFLAGTLVQVWWEAAAVCLEWAHAVEGQTVAAGPAAALSTASSTSQLAALSWQLHSTACRHVHMSLRGPSAAPPTTPASVWWGGLRTLLDSSLQFAIWCQQRKQEATGGR